MPLSAVLIPSFTSVVLPFNKVPLSGPHSPCLGLTRTVVLEKTLESPLDSKDIKPVHPKETDPEYSLEGLMLKLQYVDHLM